MPEALNTTTLHYTGVTAAIESISTSMLMLNSMLSSKSEHYEEVLKAIVLLGEVRDNLDRLRGVLNEGS